MLSVRKPTASGSRLTQRQDSEEEASSTDAEAEDRTGKGKYWLEKAAELENKTKQKEQPSPKEKESNIREKCMLWLQKGFSSRVKGLTETWVLLLRMPSLCSWMP